MRSPRATPVSKTVPFMRTLYLSSSDAPASSRPYMQTNIATDQPAVEAWPCDSRTGGTSLPAAVTVDVESGQARSQMHSIYA